MEVKQNYYRTLEIPTEATLEQIKLAYRRLVKRWHPDVNGNSYESQEKLKAINEAYEILSDETARYMYNETIAANTKTHSASAVKQESRVREPYKESPHHTSEYYTEFEKILNEYKGERCDSGFFDKINILYRDTASLSPFQRMYLFLPLLIGAIFWHGCDITSRGFCAIFDLFITK